MLLDGIPLFSAVHFSSASSAVNPDVIAGADLHAGVGSARFGDHLAGVVELETRDPGPAGFQPSGSLASTDIRQMVTDYLPGPQRASSSVPEPAFVTRSRVRATGDRAAAIAISWVWPPAESGTAVSVWFPSWQAIGSSSPWFGDVDPVSAAPEGGGEAEMKEVDGYPAEVAAQNNTIAWNSHSQGLTWSRTSASGATLETAAWWAGSSARVGWQTADGLERLRSDLSELGLSARVAWPDGITAGGSLLRPSTRYEVTTAASPSAPGLRLDAAPAVGSVFAERSWLPWNALRLTTGLRASTDFSGWAGLEPRVTALLDADANTHFGVGIGRSHQVVQSALNDESALGLLLGFDLPVAARPGLPVARADQLELLASRRLVEGLGSIGVGIPPPDEWPRPRCRLDSRLLPRGQPRRGTGQPKGRFGGSRAEARTASPAPRPSQSPG